MKPPLDKDSTHLPEPVALGGAAFSEYSAELHRYLARRILRPEDADDLAQEVYLRLMRVQAPERIRKPVAYLFSIAVHLIREFKLRVDREREHVAFDSEAMERAAEMLTAGPVEELSDRLDLQQQLARALQRLPRTQRTVLLLVKRDGLSHKEAAQATGLSVNTIERYVVEATAQMASMAFDRGVKD